MLARDDLLLGALLAVAGLRPALRALLRTGLLRGGLLRGGLLRTGLLRGLGCLGHLLGLVLRGRNVLVADDGLLFTGRRRLAGIR